MGDQLVDFRTAQLAKEKRFREFCCYAYTNDGKFMYNNKIGYYWELYTISPTQSLLQRWLREKYDIHINIEVFDDNTYEYHIISDRIDEEYNDDEYFISYETALEEALYESLKLIKTE